MLRCYTAANALGTSQHVWTFWRTTQGKYTAANASQPETSPLIINGSNQELALYAAMLPVSKTPLVGLFTVARHQAKQHHLPPNLALIIPTSGSEGMPCAVAAGGLNNSTPQPAQQ